MAFGQPSYYFPQGGTVTIRVSEKDGVKFVSFWLEHGVTQMVGPTKEVCDLYKLSEK